MISINQKERSSRYEKMKQIRDEVVALKESPLYEERVSNGVYPVLGEGNHFADIMFVGEAPGKNEAATGRPFCGAAGRILDELLESIKILRQDVYITNIVKDRPTKNRVTFRSSSLEWSPTKRTVTLKTRKMKRKGYSLGRSTPYMEQNGI